MRGSWRSAVGFAVVCGWLLTFTTVVRAEQVAASDCAGAPWMDPTKSPDERATLVIAQMTLDEKIQEMGSLRDAEHFRETPPIPRLCVPALRLNNGSAGVSTGGPVQFPATALPAPIGLAATWDPQQALQYGTVQGQETLDQGRNLLEGPDINIARVPVNGRTFEAYGEDPFLAGQTTVGDVRGIQSKGVMANAKHYAANNQETNRSTINELIDERTLHEIYLPAFEAAVKQGDTGSVMCAKNKVNGVFSCSHPELLLNILKGAWGFDGFVVSDFDSCHATVDCANNGMEFELPQARFFSNAALKAAIDAGQVTVATIDEHVHRILRTMIRFGIFDRPQTTSPIDAAGHGAVSRDISQQAAVLLKNDRRTLPLNPASLHSIAVVGPYAGTAHTGGGGSSRVMPLYTVSPLDGLRQRLGPDVTIRYAPGIATSGVSAVPPSVLTAPAVPGQPPRPGLLAEYFANATMSGTPALTRVDERIVYDWGGGAPVPGLPIDHFSVRWTGTLTAPTTGDYRFGITNDDTGRVFIDDVLVVDNGGVHGSRTRTATVNLTAGPHAVRVEYADDTGFAAVTFAWAPPGGPSAPGRTSVVEVARTFPNATDRFATSPPSGTTAATSRCVPVDECRSTERPAVSRTPSIMDTSAVGVALPNVRPKCRPRVRSSRSTSACASTVRSRSAVTVAPTPISVSARASATTTIAWPWNCARNVCTGAASSANRPKSAGASTCSSALLKFAARLLRRMSRPRIAAPSPTSTEASSKRLVKPMTPANQVSTWDRFASKVTSPEVNPLSALARMAAPEPTRMFLARSKTLPELPVEGAVNGLAPAAIWRVKMTTPGRTVMVPSALMVRLASPPPPAGPVSVRSPATRSTSESGVPSPLPVMEAIVTPPGRVTVCAPVTTIVRPDGGAGGAGWSNGVTYGPGVTAGPGPVAFGSSDGVSPRSGNCSAPFCQSLNSARNTGRSKVLSHSGKFPVPVW